MKVMPFGFLAPAIAAKTLVSHDFTTLTKGQYSAAAFNTATGFTFARASDGSTVKTSASTLASGLTGSNTARVGQYGLLVERQAINNWIWAARLDALSGVAGFSAGTSPSYQDAYVAGPDAGSPGAINADRFINPGQGYAQYLPGTASQVSSSCWVRQGGTPGVYSILIYPAVGVTGPTTTTWQQISLATSGASLFSPVDNRGILTTSSAVPIDVTMAWIMIEYTEQYVTECVYTAGSTVTRAGEQLSYTTGSSLIDSGQLSLELKFIPKGGATQYSADMYLYSDQSTSDSVWISHTTQKINVEIGGTTVTLPNAMSWNTGDTVQLFVGAGGPHATYGYYQVNGGGAIYLGVATSTGNFAPAGGVDLLCKGSANQLTCSLQKLSAWKTFKTPSWIPSTRLSDAPSTVSGLSLWLRGDTGVTLISSAVSNWADQSKYGRDASQITSGARPAVGVTIGGQTALNFTGSGYSSLVLTTPSFTTQTSRTIFVVYSFQGSQSTDGRIIETHYTTDYFIGTESGGVCFIIANGSPRVVGGTSTGACVIAATVDSSGNMSLYQNGTLVGSHAETAPTASSLIRYINGSPDGAFGSIGYMAEVIEYDHDLNGTDLNTVTSYLRTRYGI